MNDISVLHIDCGKSLRGGQRQLLLLLKHLQRSDIKHIVACPQQSGLSGEIDHARLLLLSRNSLNRKLNIGSLKELVAETGIDIIHAHDSEGHTIGLRLKRNYPDLKLVVSRRVVFAPSSSISRHWKYGGKVDLYIAVCKAAAEKLIESGVTKDKITTIPSAIDLKLIAEVEADSDFMSRFRGKNDFLVVTASALTKEKDILTAIKAVAIASKKIDRIRFCILGEGPLRPFLEKAVAELGVDNIHFWGHRDNVGAIYKGADLFLLTSVMEGMNNSAMEAAACGLPLVLSDVGGLPEIVENNINGILCPAGDQELFAQAIVNILSDEEKRRSMVQKSIEISSRFDIRLTALQIARVYDSLLAENG